MEEGADISSPWQLCPRIGCQYRLLYPQVARRIACNVLHTTLQSAHLILKEVALGSKAGEFFLVFGCER